MKVFQFITFHIELQQAQNHCALGSIKQMDLLYLLMVKIKHLVLFDYGLHIKFMIRLNIL